MPRKLERRNNAPHAGGNSHHNSSWDDLDVKIIRDMANNADVKSADLAKRYNIPLSTIQRRRTKLERTILKKQYHIDVSRLGWRQADLLIAVEKGNSEETAKIILDTCRGNIRSASLRIGDPELNLMAQALYKSSEELHGLIERIRSIPLVTSVEWSEIVKTVGMENTLLIERVFGKKQNTAGE